nr:MAG TPA: hypothetical protein [Caudoviricetes sp.]
MRIYSSFSINQEIATITQRVYMVFSLTLIAISFPVLFQ